MTPLVLLTAVEILFFTPLLFFASWFVWKLYREEPDGIHLALAVMVIAASVAGFILAVPTVFFLAGQALPFTGQLVLVSIDILLPTCSIVAGYLWWLRR